MAGLNQKRRLPEELKDTCNYCFMCHSRGEPQTTRCRILVLSMGRPQGPDVRCVVGQVEDHVAIALYRELIPLAPLFQKTLLPTACGGPLPQFRSPHTVPA